MCIYIYIYIYGYIWIYIAYHLLLLQLNSSVPVLMVTRRVGDFENSVSSLRVCLSALQKMLKQFPSSGKVYYIMLVYLLPKNRAT